MARQQKFKCILEVAWVGRRENMYSQGKLVRDLTNLKNHFGIGF